MRNKVFGALAALVLAVFALSGLAACNRDGQTAGNSTDSSLSVTDKPYQQSTGQQSSGSDGSNSNSSNGSTDTTDSNNGTTDGQAGSRADIYNAEEIVRNYVSLRVDAINDHAFYAIDNLLDQKAAVYQSEKKKYDDAINKGLSESLADLSLDTQAGDQAGVFSVNVVEKLKVKAADQTEYSDQTNEWVFTVTQTSASVLITDIQPA